MMMMTTIPVIFMSQAITRPDAPALAMLSWFPPFTPFLALCERVGVDLSRFPRTAQWAARLKNRDSYEEVKLGLTA